MDLYAFSLLHHLKVEKEVQFPNHAHVKLAADHILEFIYKQQVSGAKYDIIYVYLNHENVTLVFLDEERLVDCPPFVVVCKEVLRETIIPCSWCLLQPIECLVQEIHVLRVLWVLEAWGLLHVHFFIEDTIEEGRLHIHLKKLEALV